MGALMNSKKPLSLSQEALLHRGGHRCALDLLDVKKGKRKEVVRLMSFAMNDHRCPPSKPKSPRPTITKGRGKAPMKRRSRQKKAPGLGNPEDRIMQRRKSMFRLCRRAS